MADFKGCPADLDAASKARWRTAHADISERGWRDAYHSTLERYVRALAMCDRAIATLADEGYTVDGSKGQPVQSPWWRTYVEACRVAESAASALLLTPAARAKLGDQSPPVTGSKFGL